MDPITLAGLIATAAQSADLALKVLETLFQYLKDVRESPKRALELQMELSLLTSTIMAMQSTIEDLPCYIPQNQAALMDQALKNCKPTLKEMLQKLEKACIQGRKKGFQRLLRPFRPADVERYIAWTRRYKEGLKSVLLIQQTYVASLHSIRSILIP